MFIFAAAVLGAIIGSFLAAAVHRLAAQKPGLWTGRSACPTCGHTLATRDLVPLFSWLWLRGRCRYCQQAISARYFWTELATAASFAGATVVLGTANWPQLAAVLLATAVLIFLAAHDWQTQEIPDEVSLPALGAALALGPLALPLGYTDTFLGALVGGGFFALIILANELAKKLQYTKLDWLGGGDLRLGALIGALTGWTGFLVALFLGAVAGTVVGVFLIFKHGKNLQTAVPFGPALALGGFIALLFGQEIWGWYLV